jgi:predicted sugar kinase
VEQEQKAQQMRQQQLMQQQQQQQQQNKLQEQVGDKDIYKRIIITRAINFGAFLSHF